MLISFRGKIGCGKTTAAGHLIQTRGFTRVSFADPLKCEVFDFLWHSYDAVSDADSAVWKRFRDETGVKDLFPVPDRDFRCIDLYYVLDDQKIQWVNEHKAALRPLLQWWGTEYRRAQDEAYWIKLAVLNIKRLLTEGRNVVMDDCRFDNEMEVVSNFGGIQVYIDCPKAEALAIERSGGGAVGISGHESEKLLDKNDPRNSTVIVNDSTLEDFLHLVDTVVELERTTAP